jgi:hypothetical protein
MYQACMRLKVALVPAVRSYWSYLKATTLNMVLSEGLKRNGQKAESTRCIDLPHSAAKVQKKSREHIGCEINIIIGCT